MLSRLDSRSPAARRGLSDLSIRNQVLYSLTQYANGRLNGPATYVLLWGTVRDMNGVTDRKRPQFLAVKLANEVVGGDLVEPVCLEDLV